LATVRDTKNRKTDDESKKTIETPTCKWLEEKRKTVLGGGGRPNCVPGEGSCWACDTKEPEASYSMVGSSECSD